MIVSTMATAPRTIGTLSVRRAQVGTASPVVTIWPPAGGRRLPQRPPARIITPFEQGLAADAQLGRVVLCGHRPPVGGEGVGLEPAGTVPTGEQSYPGPHRRAVFLAGVLDPDAGRGLSRSTRTTARSQRHLRPDVTPRRSPRSATCLRSASTSCPARRSRPLQLVAAGGPFPYERDGVTFQNREGLLPSSPRATTRSTPCTTPGEDDRAPGASIVDGDYAVAYLTDDHYESFRELVPDVPVG